MSASQVLHMHDGEAPHLSHRYHVYVTALLEAYQRVIEREYSATVTVTPGTTSTKRTYWSRQKKPSVIIRKIASTTMHGTRRVG
jgi:hypothetical protein